MSFKNHLKKHVLKIIFGFGRGVLHLPGPPPPAGFSKVLCAFSFIVHCTKTYSLKKKRHMKVVISFDACTCNVMQ